MLNQSTVYTDGTCIILITCSKIKMLVWEWFCIYVLYLIHKLFSTCCNNIPYTTKISP